MSNTIPKGWRPLSDIPNSEGTSLTVMTKSGDEVQTRVGREPESGCHFLVDFKGDRYRTALAWRP